MAEVGYSAPEIAQIISEKFGRKVKASGVNQLAYRFQIPLHGIGGHMTPKRRRLMIVRLNALRFFLGLPKCKNATGAP